MRRLVGTRTRSLAHYYDWLSWFERLTARRGRPAGRETLTVHRLLRSDRADLPAGHVVHELILARISLPASPRVLDAGCGVGGTVFYLHDRLGGRYDGLTLSAGQQRRAAREARRRGVADECRFHQRSYDRPLTSLEPGGFDLIVAIESLAHSPDPSVSLQNLAAGLRPGGCLVVVDDMPTVADTDEDLAGFRFGWQCDAVARRETLREGLTAAGLAVRVDEDLTPRVTLRDADRREHLIRVNRRWARWLRRTPAAVLLDCLWGGLMLERLYARGGVEYRLLCAERPA